MVLFIAGVVVPMEASGAPADDKSPAPLDKKARKRARKLRRKALR
jgi:hypothetical protein